MADIEPIDDDLDDDSIATLFSRLIDDAERFVRAEIALYRAQIFRRLSDARIAIVLAGTAFLLAQSALIATLFGLILILRRQVGSAWATVIVVGLALLIAGILARIAIAQIRKATEIEDGPS